MIINDDTKKKIAVIAKKYELALVVLFGSQATGHTHPKSDIDIGFIARKEIDYHESYDINRAIARVFNNTEIEEVNLENVSPELKKRVAEEGILLYEENSSVFDLFKIHAFRSYVDTKPLRIYRAIRLKKFLQKTYA